MKNKLISKLRMPDGSINPWVIAITVTLATFMEVLDTSIANVALPHISGSLSAGADESTWVLTSYLVSNAIVLPLSGWLSGILGRKRFYMSCVALFTVSSFLCGLAPSLGVLVFFRILQGAGGGGLQPSEQAILNDTFPLSKRGMAFAVYGLAVVVAPTIGPWLGGYITDSFSWRWIFYINVPVGIISLILTSFLVSDPPYMKRESVKRGFRIDYIGIGLISLGLGSMQIILDKGQRDDWFASNFIWTFAVLMFVGVIGAILWELREKNPVRGGYGSDVFSGLRAVFQHGAHPAISAATAGVHGVAGGCGAVPGRRGDHVHDAGGRDTGVQSGHAHSDYLRLHRFGLRAFCDGRLEFATGLWPRGARAYVAELRSGVSFYSHQRVGVRLCASGKNEYGDGDHQSGAEHRGQRGHRHRHHHAGAPNAIASGASNGERERLQRGVSQHDERHADQAGLGGLQPESRRRAGARNDLQHGAAAGRHAGVSGQF
jgi:MFS family permease